MIPPPKLRKWWLYVQYKHVEKMINSVKYNKNNKTREIQQKESLPFSWSHSSLLCGRGGKRVWYTLFSVPLVTCILLCYASVSEYLEWKNHLAWALSWWREFSGQPLMVFWQHMLSGCQVCDWDIQSHLCSTYKVTKSFEWKQVHVGMEP